MMKKRHPTNKKLTMKQGFVSDFNALSLLASKEITYSRPKQLSDFYTLSQTKLHQNYPV